MALGSMSVRTRPTTAPHSRVESLGERIGPVILALGILVPGMIVGDLMPAWNVLPIWAWAIVAAVAGASGCALMAEEDRIPAGLGGAIGGPLALLAIPLYVDARSSWGHTYFVIELLIPALLGAAPGWVVFWLVRRIRG